MNDKPGSAERRLDPEMKQRSKQRDEVQKRSPACFPLSLTRFCISLQRALPGEEAEATKPQFSRDFSYREEEMRQLLWKKLHMGIPRPGETWYTLAFTGRKSSTAPLGKQHTRCLQTQQKKLSCARGQFLPGVWGDCTPAPALPGTP